MRRNVAVLLTRFQCEIFQQVIEREKLKNIIIIHPKQFDGYDWGFYSDIQVHSYEHSDGYLTIGNARALIREAKILKEKLQLSAKDLFWFANDGNPFVQIIYHYVGFFDTRVLEDGLGSYVLPSFFAWRAGLIAVLRKIKLIFYLFPYYRSIYRCSVDIQSNIGYAYNKNAFPGQKNIEITVVNKECHLIKLNEPAKDNSLVFIGQPLVELRVLSNDRYLCYLKKIQSEYGSLDSSMVYRPHPRENQKKLTFLELNNIKINRETSVSVEDYIYSSGSNLTVVGVASTSLVYINDMPNVKEVVAVQLPGLKGLGIYYNALKRLGVKVVESN